MGDRQNRGLRVQFDRRLKLKSLGSNRQHKLVPLLRQSIYSRLAGYEDPPGP
jgi:hypothetical protein